jgi:hypothetical protein
MLQLGTSGLAGLENNDCGIGKTDEVLGLGGERERRGVGENHVLLAGERVAAKVVNGAEHLRGTVAAVG